MTISIKELREICQGNNGENSEVKTVIWRYPSIYFTKVLLRLGFSANQVSVLGTVIVIIGFLCLLLNNIIGIIISIFFVVVGTILDNSDGEIARFRKTASPIGLQVELISHEIQFSVFFPLIGWIVYQTTGEIVFLILGFISGLTKSMFERNMISVNRALRNSSNDPNLKISKTIKRSNRNLTYYLLILYSNIFIAPYCYFLYYIAFILSLTEFFVILYALGLSSIYIASIIFGFRWLTKGFN